MQLFTSLNKALQMFAILGQGYKVFWVLKVFRVFSGAEYFYNQLKQSAQLNGISNAQSCF